MSEHEYTVLLAPTVTARGRNGVFSATEAVVAPGPDGTFTLGFRSRRRVQAGTASNAVTMTLDNLERLYSLLQRVVEHERQQGEEGEEHHHAATSATA